MATALQTESIGKYPILNHIVDNDGNSTFITFRQEDMQEVSDRIFTYSCSHENEQRRLLLQIPGATRRLPQHGVPHDIYQLLDCALYQYGPKVSVFNIDGKKRAEALTRLEEILR
jgi:hypothetical protein